MSASLRAGLWWPSALALAALALALLLAGISLLALELARGRGRGSLVFAREGDLYLLDTDRLYARRLTRSPFVSKLAPVWSPDGREIAFAGQNARRSGLTIYRMAANGRDLRRVTVLDTVNANPAWSPDGRWLAYDSASSGNPDIYLIELACAPDCAPQRLTTHPLADVNPAWSPDGRSLAFETSRHEHREIYRLDLDTGAERRLTDNRVPDRGAAWSPDGKQIAYSRSGLLHAVDADCDQQPLGCEALARQLTDLPDTASPAWSPDGRWIAFEAWSGGRWALFVVAASGGTAEPLTFSGEARAPAWWPR